MCSNIVVPLDGSDNSERSLPHVKELAQALNSTVHLVQVISRYEELQMMSGAEGSFAAYTQYQSMANQLIASRIEQAEAYLDGVQGRLEAGGIAASGAVLEGAAAEKIIEYADRRDADLIVMSTRGRGGIQRVLRSAHLPVLAIPPED